MTQSKPRSKRRASSPTLKLVSVTQSLLVGEYTSFRRAARAFFISGQKRGVFGAIKRELRRDPPRSRLRPLKNDGHLGRCYLKGRDGDAANAILTAIGYNFRLVLAWMRVLLQLILTALLRSFAIQPALRSVC